MRGPAAEAARKLCLSFLPKARWHARRVLWLNELIIRSILEVTGRRVFLDTSKDASRLRYLCDSGRFSIRVIHLIRDGRAVSYSLIRKGLSSVLAAREWLLEHKQAKRLRPRFPRDRWLELRYEDLCATPEESMREVFSFLGVKPMDTQDFRSGESHVIGNRMRLGSVGMIKLDLSWRRELGGLARERVEHVLGGLNRQYGYC